MAGDDVRYLFFVCEIRHEVLPAWRETVDQQRALLAVIEARGWRPASENVVVPALTVTTPRPPYGALTIQVGTERIFLAFDHLASTVGIGPVLGELANELWDAGHRLPITRLGIRVQWDRPVADTPRLGPALNRASEDLLPGSPWDLTAITAKQAIGEWAAILNMTEDAPTDLTGIEFPGRPRRVLDVDLAQESVAPGMLTSLIEEAASEAARLEREWERRLYGQ